MDGKFPVDASGTLPGGKHFSTPAEMRAILVSQLPQFAQAVTEKMLTYALGRGLKPEDREAVGSITARWAAENYAFQDLIFEVARSFPFQERRGEPLRRDTADGGAARFRNPVTRSCCDTRGRHRHREGQRNDGESTGTQDVFAGRGDGGGAAVSGCHDAAFAAAGGSHRCAWRSCTCRTAWTCATGTPSTRASSAN